MRVGGVMYGREAARRRHICRSINFLLCGTWVSTLAAGAHLQPSWSSDGGTKLLKKTQSLTSTLYSGR